MAVGGLSDSEVPVSAYCYRVAQRGPGEWAVERAWGGGPSWVRFAMTDNQIDAECIAHALALLDEQERRIAVPIAAEVRRMIEQERP